jgi:hypothetical protein
MKFLIVLFYFVSTQIFASSSAECHLVDGIYRNSPNPISQLKFQTVVDVFTISNANQLSMNLDGMELTFLRSNLTVKKQVKMIYLVRKNGQALRAAHVMIDRTPKEVISDREFYGNMIITGNLNNEPELHSILTSKNLVYNFYCRL